MNKELTKIVNKLKKLPGVNEIALFGSRSRGQFKPKSDYDIMVFCNPNIEIPKQKYEESFALPEKYDIKFINDRKYYGDLMHVTDRRSWHSKWQTQGTPISVAILKDMKPLWRKK